MHENHSLELELSRNKSSRHQNSEMLCNELISFKCSHFKEATWK